MKPRRSIISVPGHMEKMHIKAARSVADAVLLDLEDSVPMDAKASAREQVIRSIHAIDWERKAVGVRINSIETPFAYREIVDVAENVGHRLDSIVIPKVDHPGDIHFADRLLQGIETAKGFKNRIAIEASIETARGLDTVSAIASASSRIISLVFGIADYSASIGARLISLSGHGEKDESLYPGHRWHFALSRIVMAAKANGLLAVDAPYGHFKDPEGLMKSSVMACALGCDGKWAIHPDQLSVINHIFSPSPEDIERASAVVKAFEAASAEGKGAVAVEGRMIDQATVRLARRLLEQARGLALI